MVLIDEIGKINIEKSTRRNKRKQKRKENEHRRCLKKRNENDYHLFINQTHLHAHTYHFILFFSTNLTYTTLKYTNIT